MKLRDLRALIALQLGVVAFSTFWIYEFGLPEISMPEAVSQLHGRRSYSYLREFDVYNVKNLSTKRPVATEKLQPFNATTNQPLEWTGVEFIGQLGNQMFELASAYGIAQVRRSRVCVKNYAATDLPESIQLLANISECPPLHFDNVWESGFATFESTLMTARGNIMVGQFLQSYRYFDEVPFVLKPMAWAELWVKEHGVAVGIHVRRGDYVMNPYNGGRPPPALYFEYCLHVLRQRHGQLKAVVVSDDPEWVRAQPIFADAIVQHGSPAEDMAVLAACEHVVASIGTFGWWAMRLKATPGERLYYADPWNYTVVPDRQRSFTAADHFPPEWVGVGDAELESFRSSPAYVAPPRWNDESAARALPASS